MTTKTRNALRRLRHNVACIETAETSGSAFLLRRSGDSALLLSNYHVIPADPSTEFTVTLRNEAEKEIEGRDPCVIWFDRLTDFVVFEVGLPRRNGLPRGLMGNDFEPPQVGDEVFAIGNPGYLRQVVTRGILADGFHDGDAPQLLVDLHLYEGNSGGPLLDRRGRLIGLVTAGFADGFEGLNIATPIEYVFERLDPLFEMDLALPEARPLPRRYETPHELDPGSCGDARLVDRVKDHVQCACGLDLHRRFQLAHFKRDVAGAAGERFEITFDNRDGSDRVVVELEGGRYTRIEHTSGDAG